MGAASSTNVTDVLTSAIVKQSISITNDSFANTSQNIIIDIEDVKNDVNFKNNDFSQTVSIDVQALQNALSSQAAQQQILQSVTQSAKSLVSGLNFAQFSEASNESTATIKALTETKMTALLKCMATNKQTIQVKIARVGRDVNVENNKFEQAATLVEYCAQKTVAGQTAVQNLSNIIKQSATATSEGLTLWPLVVVICVFLIVAGATTGTVVKSTVGNTTKSLARTLTTLLGIGAIITGIVFLGIYSTETSSVWTMVPYAKSVRLDDCDTVGSDASYYDFTTNDEFMKMLTSNGQQYNKNMSQPNVRTPGHPKFKPNGQFDQEYIDWCTKIPNQQNIDFMKNYCHENGYNAMVYKIWDSTETFPKVLEDADQIFVAYKLSDPEACFKKHHEDVVNSASECASTNCCNDSGSGGLDCQAPWTMREFGGQSYGNIYPNLTDDGPGGVPGGKDAIDSGTIGTGSMSLPSFIKKDDTTKTIIGDLTAGKVLVAWSTDTNGDPPIIAVWIDNYNSGAKDDGLNVKIASTGVPFNNDLFISSRSPPYAPGNDLYDDTGTTQWTFGSGNTQISAYKKTSWLNMGNPISPILYKFQTKKNPVDEDFPCNDETGPKWYHKEFAWVGNCEWAPTYITYNSANGTPAMVGTTTMTTQDTQFLPNVMLFNYVPRKKWMLYIGISVIVLGIIVMVLPRVFGRTKKTQGGSAVTTTSPEEVD